MPPTALYILRRIRVPFRLVVLYGIVALLVIGGVAARIPQRLNYTGDEPRYLLFALSLALEGQPLMSPERYEEFRHSQRPGFNIARDAFDVMQGGARRPAHSIAFPLLLAPFSLADSVPQVRFAVLALGAVGLGFLAKLLVNQKAGLVATSAAFAPAALLFPALPYYFLALPEVALFISVSIAFWNLTGSASLALRSYVPAIFSSCLAPYFHLRGLALFGATGLFLLFALLVNPQRERRWRAALTLCGIFGVNLALLALFNWSIHRDVLGSTNTARPEWTVTMFQFMFVDFRAGLFAYAPIWMLSFAGLLAALWSRQRWSVLVLLYLAALLVTSARPIGEAYPARFWVQAVPALALSLLGFTAGKAPAVFKVGIYAILFSISLANSWLFFFDNPDLHLAARTGAYPYERLFELYPHLHLGFWIDLLYDPAVRTAVFVSYVALVFVIGAASAVRSVSLATVATVLLLAGVELHRARSHRTLATLKDGAVVATLPKSDGTTRRRIRLSLQPAWQGYVPLWDVDVFDGATRWRGGAPSAAVLYTKGVSPAPVTTTIRWDPPARPPEPSEFRAIVCRSKLERLW